MERIAEVTVRFEFPVGAQVTFNDSLELSLDCPVCRRCCRTVAFWVGESEGRCSPTRHAFPGRIINKQVAQEGKVTSVVFRVRYSYEPFTDAKYLEKRKPSGEPTWGRIQFQVKCPLCGEVRNAFTQTNIVRPWLCQCKCGCDLYTDQDLQPVLSWTEAPVTEL